MDKGKDVPKSPVEPWVCNDLYNLFTICRGFRYQLNNYWREGKVADCYPYLEEFQECMKAKFSSPEVQTQKMREYRKEKDERIRAERAEIWLPREQGEPKPLPWGDSL